MLFDTLDANEEMQQFEKAQKFRKKRLKKICKGKVWGPLDETPHCVLHWLPISKEALFKPDVINTVEFSKFIKEMDGAVEMRNLDGVRFYSTVFKESKKLFFGNVQVFHSGALEITLKLPFNEDDSGESKKIPQGVLVKSLRGVMDGFKECISSFKIDVPIVVGISFLHVSNCRFHVDSHVGFFGPSPRSDREKIILPEALIKNLNDMEEIEQQIFDMLWMSFGLLKCEYYENGKRRVSRG